MTSARRYLFCAVALAVLSFPSVLSAAGFEFSGFMSAEGRLFFNEPAYDGQDRDSVSLAIQPEFYYEWETGSSVTFVPFARFDSADPERTHYDIRELNYLLPLDLWELRVGVGKVFWGVTEFLHLVDIINQTDLVEEIDGEDKLGQPMVQVSVPGDWGVVDVFVLPYFRERTFPGRKGRLRTDPEIDTDRALYESGAEEYHIDLAARYSHTIDGWDFGVYHFSGTSREPRLFMEMRPGGDILLRPFYEQIDQTGLDAQFVTGNWLLKLEALYRSSDEENFYAATGGFEYSLINIASSGIDLGLIGEFAYDDRGDEATTIFDNDIMLGLRVALNDVASTEALLGLILDVDGDGAVFTLESSRRINNNWTISLDMFVVLDSSMDEALIHFIRDDDYLELELSYYF